MIWPKSRYVAIAILAVVGIVVALQVWSHRDEKASEKIGAGKQIVAEQTPIYQKAETLFVHDTVRLSRLVVQHDTILKEMRITDTVWVKNYIASSEATIKACTETVGDCTAAKAALQRINEGLRLELEGERAKQPGRIRSLLGHVRDVGIGYGACRVEGAFRR
jgi:hypothetical protein